MAFVVADRVKETCTGTSGAMSLAGAVTGFQTFVAGIGDNNTCPYVIEDADGSAWEVGIGTVDDATPDTLTRTTFLASSTGSAVTFSGGTHTVYCGWTARMGQQSYLSHVAGTDADTTMAVGQLYVVDMSAWATADRTYTLPASAAVGDRVGIMLTAGCDGFELVITAATSDTLNGVAGGTAWSRVFIAGETVIMRCVTADSAWIVEVDGRIQQKARMSLDTDITTGSTGYNALLLTDTDFAVGAVVTHSTTSKIRVRRPGKYFINGSWSPKTGATVADNEQCGWTASTGGAPGAGGTIVATMVPNHPGTASKPVSGTLLSFTELAVDDLVQLNSYAQTTSNLGARGLQYVTYLAVSEVL